MRVKAHFIPAPELNIINLEAGDVFRFVNSTEVLMKLDTSKYNEHRPAITQKNPLNQAVILSSGKTRVFPMDSPNLYRQIVRQVPSHIIGGSLVFEDVPHAD